MKIRAQIAMVMNLDKCIGCHTCSVTCKNVWTSRLGMDRDQARRRLPEGLGESGALARRLGAPPERQDRPQAGRALVDPGEDLRQPALAGDRRLLRALHLRLRAFASRAGTADRAGGAPAFARQRPPDGQDRMGSEL